MDHRSEIRRDDGDDGEDHPLRPVAGIAEVLADLDPLEKTGVLCVLLGPHLLPELLAECIEVESCEKDPDGLRTHAGLEGVLAIAVDRLHILVLGQQLLELQVGVAGIRDDILLIIQDGLEIRPADVQEKGHARRHAPVVPDVGHRAGKSDVAHPLAADLRARDLDSTAVAYHSLVADGLELAAVALPFLRRSEYPLTEEAVLLGAESPVVYGLGLLDLAI